MTPQSEGAGFAGIGMMSSLFSGIAQYKAGQAEKSADDYNAEITLQNMSAQMVASKEKYSQIVGKQGAAYARAGVDISSGSPLLIMTATAGRGGEEAEQIREAGTEEATLQRYYGKLAAWKGTTGGIGDFLSGISSSLANYYKQFPSVPGGGGGDGGGGNWTGSDDSGDAVDA